MISATKEFLHFHLTLQLHHTVKDSFRTRRATRDVNIYRNQLIYTTYYVVALLERSATNRATTNGHYVFRLRNLVDRKSTRLNSSHANISYAVFCLKKKIKHIHCHTFTDSFPYSIT